MKKAILKITYFEHDDILVTSPVTEGDDTPTLPPMPMLTVNPNQQDNENNQNSNDYTN